MENDRSAHNPPHKRTAFVTGGAHGLGEAIAERLAADGIAVAIADIDLAGAQRNAARLGARGAESLALHMDAGDPASIAQAIDATLRHFCGIDILVNCAGVSGMRAPLEDMTLEDWERVVRINLTGAFLACKAVIPQMKRRGWGRIVNVSSQAGRARTGGGKAQYAASKAGMIGFSRVLADEVGRDGITVNCIAPGRTMTSLTMANAAGNPDYFASGIAQTALGRLAVPRDSANAVAFLCSDQAGFLTGMVIDVNGGAFMA
ncbi:MAG: SDR family NAD(P)-dependent oxidoreductase [Sphingomonas bacterium]